MKKTIVILCVFLAILAGCVAFFMQQSHRKVSDFGIFPCEFASADAIEMVGNAQTVKLAYQNGHWVMTSPVSENIDQGAEHELKRFLMSKVFVDEKQSGSAVEPANFDNTHATKLTFSKSGSELCSFELGKAYKYATVNSERRWVRMHGDAYRVFVHLMDFGPLFEQPAAGWRNKNWLHLSTRSTQAITFSSGTDNFKFDRSGEKNSDNPQGWRLVSGQIDGKDVDVEHFELDESRIATVVELLTPFFVDDWADGLDEHVVQAMQFGGKMTLETDDGVHEIHIGPEIDARPEWAWLGKGSRFVRLDNDPRVGIVTSEHLYGLYPSLNDMRSKKVWKLDTTRFSGIEVSSGDACLRYAPAKENWVVKSCLGENSPHVDETPLSPTALGNYAKLLMALEAFRYAVDEEASATTDGAELRIYEETPENLTTVLQLSEARKSNFRYARITHIKDSERMEGPLFVITETISRLLLEDQRLRK